MRIFLVCLCAWFIAQLMKVIINSIKYAIDKKKGNVATKVTIETLFKLGGMPSSHTATVIALGTCVGALEGWDSTIFAVAGVFAFITMSMVKHGDVKPLAKKSVLESFDVED